jgi:hypothetical protein
MPIERTKGNGSYAPLSATYYRDDALLSVSEGAELLYVRGLAFCAETVSDGFISDRQLVAVVGIRLRSVPRRAAELCEVELWSHVTGGYVVRSWLKWNRSAEDIGRYKRNDRERKASAKHALTCENVESESTVPVGIRPESARNPTGVRSDSDSQSTVLHNTAQHSTEVLPPASPNGAALVPAAESLNQRAQRLTKAYTDVQPMSKFPAVLGIVKTAIAAHHGDDEIIPALLRLARDGRGVTTETLRVELQGLPAPRGQPKRSTTDERVMAGLELAAKYEEEEKWNAQKQLKS